MAESTVNQVLNGRMYKRQQMRWTPRVAHLLAQAHCAVIYGHLISKFIEYRSRQRKQPDEVPEDVARFLDLLQRAAA